jgi:outer membrane protein assembly factor BamB
MNRLLLVPILGLLCASSFAADDWPQWLGPQRDGVWRESGIVEKFSSDKLTPRWRVSIGPGYSGPAVAGAHVFVMDRTGAADTPKSVGVPGIGKRYEVEGQERVLCLDDATGKVLWTHAYPSRYDIAYPSGPRATPTVSGGKVYTLGAMGDLFCLDEATGRVLWSKNYVEDFAAKVPLYGFASAPIIEEQQLICVVGGAGSVVVSFDKNTGAEKWRALSASAPGSCAPMIIEAGGKRQIIVWHCDALVSLDPATGKVFWSEPFDIGYEMAIVQPRFDGRRLFITSFRGGSMMLQLAADTPTASVVWKNNITTVGGGRRSTLGLHGTMGAPVLRGDMIYGVCAGGQLRGVNAGTGERLWETFAATGGKGALWGNAYIVPHEDRYFLYNEKGDLLIGRLTPTGFDEISRTHLLDPDDTLPARPVTWSHPAFAHRNVYARSDSEIISVSLAAENQTNQP